MTPENRANEAARWIAKLDREQEFSDPLDIEKLEAASPEFSAWVDASYENRVEFLRAASAWLKIGRISSADPAGERWRSRRVTQLAKLGGSVTALAACVAILFAFIIPDRQGTLIGDAGLTPLSRMVSEVGSLNVVTLEDGSVISINTDTELTTRITDDIRLVYLERGEAFFEVESDLGRPFIVIAGEKHVRATGTKFSVFRKGDELEVLVIEGSVEVEAADRKSEAPIIALKKGDVALASGQEVLSMTRSEQELVAALDWRNGYINFQETTLVEAAAEFNRYNRQQILVSGSDIARLKIGGRFEAKNVEGFARLLEAGFGLTVERDKGVIRISE